MQCGKTKKVLVYYSKLNPGGAEKSTLRLIKKMLDAKWSVDLLLRYGGGVLESELPKEVNVMYYRGDGSAIEFLKSKKVIDRIKGIVMTFSMLICQMVAELKLNRRFYDIAIVGLQGLNAKVIARKVNADLKLLWIRNDLRKCDSERKVRDNIETYKKEIDYYPCVSETVVESFQESFPELANRAVLFYNVLEADDMKRKMNAESVIDGKYKGALKVVTVCRISDKSKGIFRMLDIYERLRNEGIFFYWIVVGDGTDFAELKKRVNDKGFEDGFILLGNQKNPFPIYRECDIAAVFSYYEGLCGNVNEAKVAGLPVVATQFSGINEQIISGENGLIVDNTFDGAYEGLKKMLLDEEFRNAVTNDYINKQIVNDDYKLDIFEMLAQKKGK